MVSALHRDGAEWFLQTGFVSGYLQKLLPGVTAFRLYFKGFAETFLYFGCSCNGMGDLLLQISFFER